MYYCLFFLEKKNKTAKGITFSVHGPNIDWLFCIFPIGG